MKKPTPELALLLRRMSLFGRIDNMRGVEISTHAIKGHGKRVVSSCQPLVDELLKLELPHRQTSPKNYRFWLPEGFLAPTVAEVLAGVNTGKRSVNELSAYLLLRGRLWSQYGGPLEWDADLTHALACGIDWEQTSAPENELWTEFSGTYAEPDRESMTSMTLVCRCGYVGSGWDAQTCRIGVEELTVAELMQVVLGEMHDEL